MQSLARKTAPVPFDGCAGQDSPPATRALRRPPERALQCWPSSAIDRSIAGSPQLAGEKKGAAFEQRHVLASALIFPLQLADACLACLFGVVLGQLLLPADLSNVQALLSDRLRHLQIEVAITCKREGMHQLARLMRANGLRALHASRMRHIPAARPQVLMANTRQRRFSVSRWNEAWVTEIIYIRAWERALYLAVVLGSFPRKLLAVLSGRRPIGNSSGEFLTQSRCTQRLDQFR